MKTIHSDPTNPWEYWSEAAQQFVGTCDVKDRLRKIQNSLDLNWLRLVLNYPYNQKSVNRAAQIRLRKLRKLGEHFFRPHHA